MNVIIYVEGRSDINAMNTLLKSLIERKKQEGITIRFVEAPEGNKKESVTTKIPKKAVDILRNDSTAIVIAVPDLYPKNKGFDHETFEELKEGMIERFKTALRAKKIDDERLLMRFQLFCFKHDLEALVLAAESQLKNRLGGNSFPLTWTIPVEDQNHDRPPKRIVEELFQKAGQKYKAAVDIPMIFSQISYQEIVERCPQCFAPFVCFLESLS